MIGCRPCRCRSVTAHIVTIKKKTESEEKKIQKILKATEIETSKTKSSNVEESILNKIKK